jgi:uncharacterized protein YwqG
MNSPEIARALQPWLDKHRRPAWKPIVEAGDGPPTASKFCGTPWIGPDAPWPECGFCRNPLPLFLQLDLESLPAELGGRFGTGLLQLFYCPSNDCSAMGGWEPFADDLSRVRVVRPVGPSQPPTRTADEAAFAPHRIIGWSELGDLPDPEENEELGLFSEYDFKAATIRLRCPELNFDAVSSLDDCQVEEIADAAGGDKLGGWPAWVQGAEYPHCPRCRRRMVHLFQVDSEDNIPFMFGDMGCGHITQCPEHKDVVAFGWACS